VSEAGSTAGWAGPTRTATPEHSLPVRLLDRLGVDVDGSGVVLGRDSRGRPVRLRVFAPRPVELAFVGPWWVAQILVLRCLAHGAVVAVEAVDTPVPEHVGTAASLGSWLTLDRAAGGATSRVLRRPADLTAWPASASTPLLAVHDVGPTGTNRPPPPRPWQARLTVHRGLSTAAIPTLVNADVVLVHRLDAADAALLGSALTLDPRVLSHFPLMSDDMVVALEGAYFRYVGLTPTSVERHLLGHGSG
jgi:hypothetical protein